MHRTLGIERGVLVQPTPYGTDHTLLLEALAEDPHYRGVAIVDDSVSDAELARLDRAGVRAARFTFEKTMRNVGGTDVFERAVARIAELGWHVRIHISGEELVEFAPLLQRVRVPAVLDHMVRLDFSKGRDQPGFALALDFLKNENWWIMVSNGDRFAPGGAPWDEAVAWGRTFIAAAPDRAIWCTDWPHVRYRKPQMVNDADALELLYRYTPDAAIRQKVLVDNPARLMGFETT